MITKWSLKKGTNLILFLKYLKVQKKIKPILCDNLLEKQQGSLKKGAYSYKTTLFNVIIQICITVF